MKVKDHLPLREAWVICFLLGVVMLNFPFLHIFNKDVQVFGVPLLVLYLLIGWPASILVVYLFSLYLGKEPAVESDGQSTPGSATKES